MALHDLQVGREQEERDRYLEVSDKITRLLVAHPFDLRAIVEGTAKIAWRDYSHVVQPVNM